MGFRQTAKDYLQYRKTGPEKARIRGPVTCPYCHHSMLSSWCAGCGIHHTEDLTYFDNSPSYDAKDYAHSRAESLYGDKATNTTIPNDDTITPMTVYDCFGFLAFYAVARLTPTPILQAVEWLIHND